MWRSGWRLSGRVLAAVGGSSLLCMSAGPNLGLGSPPPARASARALPTFSFGVIADVQWADLPDGTNFAGTTRRCYRGALAQLSDAVDWWRALERPPGFIAQLGDLFPSSKKLTCTWSKVTEERHYKRLVRKDDGPEYTRLETWKPRNLQHFQFILLSKLPTPPAWCADSMFVIRVASTPDG